MIPNFQMLLKNMLVGLWLLVYFAIGSVNILITIYPNILNSII